MADNIFIQRLAELEQQLKQHEIVVGENKFKMNKLEQEIELLTEQIEDNDRQASHSRKLLDEKVKKYIWNCSEYHFGLIILESDRN